MIVKIVQAFRLTDVDSIKFKTWPPRIGSLIQAAMLLEHVYLVVTICDFDSAYDFVSMLSQIDQV